MNKTLYVKECEVATWELAEKLAPKGLSVLVTDLLREYVKQNRPPAKEGYERIELDTQATDESPVIKKAFNGRVLISLDERISYGDCDYMVAQTLQNRFAVYVQNESNGVSQLHVDENFEAFRKHWPEHVVAAVAEKLGRPFVVELNI